MILFFKQTTAVKSHYLIKTNDFLLFQARLLKLLLTKWVLLISLKTIIQFIYCSTASKAVLITSFQYHMQINWIELDYFQYNDVVYCKYPLKLSHFLPLVLRYWILVGLDFSCRSSQHKVVFCKCGCLS